MWSFHMQVSMMGIVSFFESRREVSDLQHARVQPTAVRNVNIRRVKELILGER
jgi:hypothetical protein